jgi:hypothetical protein
VVFLAVRHNGDCAGLCVKALAAVALNFVFLNSGVCPVVTLSTTRCTHASPRHKPVFLFGTPNGGLVAWLDLSRRWLWQLMGISGASMVAMHTTPARPPPHTSSSPDRLKLQSTHRTCMQILGGLYIGSACWGVFQVNIAWMAPHIAAA